MRIFDCEYCYQEAYWRVETVNGPRYMCQSHYTTYTRDLKGEQGARMSEHVAALIREFRAVEPPSPCPDCGSMRQGQHVDVNAYPRFKWCSHNFDQSRVIAGIGA